MKYGSMRDFTHTGICMVTLIKLLDNNLKLLLQFVFNPFCNMCKTNITFSKLWSCYQAQQRVTMEAQPRSNQ